MFITVRREMKQRYRVFRRAWGTYYYEDLVTRKQESLHTRDKDEAFGLVAAKNETNQAPAFSLHLARVYWKAGDPVGATRTRQHVMEEIPKLKKGDTHRRWLTAIKDEAFDPIRNLVVLETQSEHFLRVLEAGCVSTNIYLRRIHNFALDMNWLPWPVIPKKRWPQIVFKEKRAITWEEHQKILAGESNAELRIYYELLWHLGGSQSDMATLCAEDIDWSKRAISYARMKAGSQAVVHFGDIVAEILKSRPKTGYLFPQIAQWKESDRGKAFIRRCRLVGVSGVCLHSYRYSWAERAKQCGYPERFAQLALGHNSVAVHRACARKAKVETSAIGGVRAATPEIHCVAEAN
jgi:integrase